MADCECDSKIPAREARQGFFRQFICLVSGDIRRRAISLESFPVTATDETEHTSPHSSWSAHNSLNRSSDNLTVEFSSLTKAFYVFFAREWLAIGAVSQGAAQLGRQRGERTGRKWFVFVGIIEDTRHSSSTGSQSHQLLLNYSRF